VDPTIGIHSIIYNRFFNSSRIVTVNTGMEKIDFFGGTHGHFLELMINLFIYQIEFNEENFFTENGTCHTMNKNLSYRPKIKCHHYSYFNKIPFNFNDLVIEIHCNDDFMLPALVNSVTRAGDQIINLSNLEIDTIKKLSHLPKAAGLLTNLSDHYGSQQHYPRSAIRNDFYSKFNIPEYGVDLFNTFNHIGKKLIFPFSAFFDYEELCLNLNKCAFFLGMNFYPTARTYQIWKKFIQVNQGYYSHKRCKKAMYAILAGDSMNISDFDVVEEAWLLNQVTRIFRCFDHPLLITDQFVSDTKDFSKIIYAWKGGDYANPP